jgi:dienelactone hydrolase
MALARAVSVLVLLLGSMATARNVAPARNVTVTAPDGTALKATYYAAAKPGPAVLLLHMCNTTRKSWEPLGPQLAAAGINALAVDYRGFGESQGQRFDALTPQDGQKTVDGMWPGDIDAAYDFLLSQGGVDKLRVGAAGGSCGVTQAVRLARRHSEVRSLVLLAGPLDPEGLQFIQQATWLPIFSAAASDDQYDNDAPGLMRWMVEVSGNPRNRFSGFKDGKHGTEIFAPHPELMKQIVEWYDDTLIRNPADPKVAVKPKSTPMREFWQTAATTAGVPAAVKMSRELRQRDPHTMLFPESQLNLLGYQYLQTGNTKAAIELFKLNTEVYPTSANTYDSLGDAYLADGQNDLALQASHKAIEMLPGDAVDENRKKAIRDSAEQKIAKLKAK